MIWQPIETAPKEIVYRNDMHRYGDYILGYDGCEVFRMRWWDANDPGETRFCNFLNDGGNAVRPTHWMPLPDPPANGMDPANGAASADDTSRDAKAFGRKR